LGLRLPEDSHAFQSFCNAEESRDPERSRHPTDVIRPDWNTEEFTRGYYGGRSAASTGPARGNGYMDRAVRSGDRAADEILAEL
jgi:hypothetical protein